MNNEEVLSLIGKINKHHLLVKVDYWQAAGMALLGSDGLGEKWCTFVEKHVNSDNEGIWLDEMLQIISMVKLNIPIEMIAHTVEQIPDWERLFIYYMGAFVNPEILYQIVNHINSKSL